MISSSNISNNKKYTLKDENAFKRVCYYLIMRNGNLLNLYLYSNTNAPFHNPLRDNFIQLKGGLNKYK